MPFLAYQFLVVAGGRHLAQLVAVEIIQT